MSRVALLLLLLAIPACGGRETGANPATGGGGATGSSTSSGGTAGSASGSRSGAGAGAASGAASGAGAGADSGASTGSSSAGGNSGVASGSGASGSDSGASTGSSSGASTGSRSGVSASCASGSTATSGQRVGRGCGLAPVGATATGFTSHTITIPACAAGPVTPDCIAPAFAPGGISSQANASEDFTHRDYAIQLPLNYDPSTAYRVVFGGGGCGGTPPQLSGGFDVGSTGSILVGLSYVHNCFADGGNQCSGAGAVDACVNGPEVPYFSAVVADVEAKYCVDLGNIFVGGYASGGWEAMTLGCGAAHLLRGFVSYGGGKREHQPPCTGPIASLMVVRPADTVNPVGPLGMIDRALDSYGSAPERDDLLRRNGCVGVATAMYDPRYPACVTYTGCPAAYPVVWCPLPGPAAQNPFSSGGVKYVGGGRPMWHFLSTLPPVP